VAEYNVLALATCAAIRAVDPQAVLLGPATSELPLRFLEDCFASGLLQHLDAVSVHPYRDYAKAPETVAGEYAALRQLMDRHAPPRRTPLPIVSSEWGYASHTRGVTPELQAAFAARQQLVNLLHGVPVSIWYDWKNDGPDPAEREHNFGVVNERLEAKPAARALRTLTGELAGYRLERRLSVGDDRDYVLLFSRPRGAPKLAVWTQGEPHPVTLTVKPRARAVVRVVDSAGGVVGLRQATRGAGAELSLTAAGPAGQSVRLERGRLTVDLGSTPLYLTLDGVRVVP
jgi:hypothetical protein